YRGSAGHGGGGATEAAAPSDPFLPALSQPPPVLATPEFGKTFAAPPLVPFGSEAVPLPTALDVAAAPAGPASVPCSPLRFGEGAGGRGCLSPPLRVGEGAGGRGADTDAQQRPMT